MPRLSELYQNNGRGRRSEKKKSTRINCAQYGANVGEKCLLSLVGGILGPIFCRFSSIFSPGSDLCLLSRLSCPSLFIFSYGIPAVWYLFLRVYFSSFLGEVLDLCVCFSEKTDREINFGLYFWWVPCDKTDIITCHVVKIRHGWIAKLQIWVGVSVEGEYRRNITKKISLKL